MNLLELVMVLHRLELAFFVKEFSQFPMIWGRVQTFMCSMVRKIPLCGDGDIWNFGKHLSQLVVLLSIHIMLVCLFVLMF